jgi:hypothetical protein
VPAEAVAHRDDRERAVTVPPSTARGRAAGSVCDARPMSRRRRALFAAPLVVTVAFAPGCEQRGTRPPPERPPPLSPEVPEVPPPLTAHDAGAGEAPAIRFTGFQCLAGPPGRESTVRCPPELIPEAAPGTAVVQQGDDCRTLGRALVRCPPTIALPEPRTRRLGRAHVAISDHTFGCETWEDMSCPPGATCNPPPPEPVACPDDLLPRLLPGIAPTARPDDGCLLGEVRVVCPEDLARPAQTTIPDPDDARARIIFHGQTQDCWRHFSPSCPPRARCNPPPPRPVACPDELLPTLVNGAAPTRKDDGTCWWGAKRVRC